MAIITGTTGGDTLEGTLGSDTIYGLAGVDYIWGDDYPYFDSIMGDSDLIYGGDDNDWIKGQGGDDTIHGDAGTDHLMGDAGDDHLYGGAGGDYIEGGAGADILDGGVPDAQGANILAYRDSVAGVGVTVNLTTGAASGGDAEGDVFTNFESIDGTSWADNLTGDAETNVLYGKSGDDVLSGGGDYDYLFGEDGDDLLYGDAGDDSIEGGAGADLIDGGDGADMVLYEADTVGVNVNLATGVGTGGDAAGDDYISIEEARGGNGNDILTGNSGDNRLYGDDDDDLDDYGDDILRGGAGADHLDGGGGTDLVSYWDSSVGVTANLLTGLGSGGDAQGDVYVSVENVNGSQGNDALTGTTGANSLSGWGGSDTLRGGAGADQLDGGTGTDLVSYWDSSVGVTTNLSTGQGSGGDAQGDGYISIENINGSQGGDTLIGNTVANVLNGFAGADSLDGGGGQDALDGGAGKDTLTGGADADRFVFSVVGDSVVGANADRIADFSHAQGDRVDLSVIDADTGVAGNQAFTFIGTALYSGVAGQLRYVISGSVTTIAGDVNGDGTSDFHIQLTGAIALVAGDFVL